MTYSKTQAPTVPNSISRLYGDCQRPLSKLEAAKTITATPSKNDMVPTPLTPPPVAPPAAPNAQSTPIPDPERPPSIDAETGTPPKSARRRSQKRGRVLLQVLLTVLAGVTLTGVSLAALSPSHKGHEPSSTSARRPSVHGSADHSTPPKAGTRAAAHPTALATPSPAKHPVELHKTQQKSPHHARLAAKPKAPKRAHQTASKPAKPAAKAKHIA